MTSSRVGLWPNHLAEFRTQQGISQLTLANHISLAQTTVAAIENGIISGRKYMDAISEKLEVPAVDIFPYYDYYSLEQAANIVSVQAATISRYIDNGIIPCDTFGGVRMVPKDFYTDEVKSAIHRGPTIKQFVLDALMQNANGGLTTDDFLELMGDVDDPRKKRQSIQSILSRSPEIYSDKTNSPPKWRLVES